MNPHNRASGVLLQITCLPSDFGIGDFGPWSYRFVDLLSRIKQRYWNILPISPTSIGDGNSPYKPTSAFAGNTLLISPEILARDGLISREYAHTKLKLPSGRVDYRKVSANKGMMLMEAYRNFRKDSGAQSTCNYVDFAAFCSQNSKWLDDHALYAALRERSGKPWHLWPRSLRDREAQAIAKKEQSMKELIEREKFAQFIFFKQWKSLKNHCRKERVSIIGDLPFYVSYDSSEVWAHPELFKLDAKKKPKYVGGVPPDYFSKDGQLWGNPVYDWKELKSTDFQWWTDRIRHNLRLFDVLRFDHFRGFIAYWQIPGTAETARRGRWIRVPSKSFLGTLESCFADLPFIAEDLGVITDNVREAMRRLGIPGIRVLLFAFDGDRHNSHLPSNYSAKSVVFTGTHDTNTVKGWFVEESTVEQREGVFKCIGRKVSAEEVSNEFIKLALASKADLSIVPLQDALSLGAESRMNHPARRLHNWEWRVTSGQLASKNLEKVGEMTEEFCRGYQS